MNEKDNSGKGARQSREPYFIVFDNSDSYVAARRRNKIGTTTLSSLTTQRHRSVVRTRRFQRTG